MSETSKAVFLSYASQDAEAAKRICEALRGAGVEVWFDQNELRGGDAWDQKIRRQIKECALFVPVISANTDARPEGYFRLEWLLAVERARLMADDHPFLFPIAIGELNEAKARVPEKFREVQWTRVRLDETPAELAVRVARLLTGGAQPAGAGDAAAPRATQGRAAKTAGESPRWWKMAFPVAGTLMGLVWATKVFWQPRRDAGEAKPAAVAAAEAKGTGQTEARQLVARAWGLLNKPELSRLELEAADDLCRRAATLDPTDAEVQAAWSQVDSWMLYQHLDLTAARQASARSKATRALQLAPQSYEARLAQACFLVRGRGDRGRPDNVAETEAALRALLAERPEEPRALLALGILLRNVERPEEARTTFETLARNPVFAAVGWNEVGWLHFGSGAMTLAEEALNKSLKVQPYRGNLGLQTRLASQWHGDVDAMKAAFDRMPESFRRSEQGMDFALMVHYLRRDVPACLRLLDEFPGDWIVGFNNGPKAGWAMLVHRLGGRDREGAKRLAAEAALRVLDQRLAASPSDPLALEWKGVVLAELDQREAAEQLFRRARESRPEADWMFELQEALALQRMESAIDTLEREVAKGPRPNVTAAIMRLYPGLDPLRGHPRFVALQAKLDADPRFTPTPKRTAATEAAKSIAVLAFKNLSDDREMEYFSEGVSEELSNVLGRVPGLQVTASTSAFAFKGRSVPVAEIARQLGVAYVVEGSVRKMGPTMRINAKLVKAADGFQVWSSGNLEREVRNVFAVQDEIAGLIAEALSLKLGAATPRAVAGVNPQAFDYYVQARQEWNRRTPEGFERAEGLLRRALDLEPEFARAHAALADVWTLRGQENGAVGKFADRGSALQREIVARIRLALRFDPGSAEALASLGNSQWVGWALREAEQSLRQAITLNPSYASAHQWLGRVLLDQGRMDEAIAALQQAMELDPLSSRIADNRALASLLAGRYSEALGLYDRALGLRPDSMQALTQKAITLADLGRGQDAVALLGAITEDMWALRSRDNRVEVLARTKLAAEAGKRLSALDPTRHDCARMLVLLGKTEEGVGALKPDVVLATTIHQWLWLPAIDPIRGDPQFTAFLATLGLTEAHARAQAWRQANPPEKPGARR